jgi:plastocyanin
VRPPRSNNHAPASHPALAAVAPLAAGLILVLAACTASSPGWTYDPAIGQPTAVPSGAGTGPTSGPGPTVPTGSLAPSAAAGGSPGAAGGTSIDLAAKNIAFDQSSLSAPANAPFVIHFDNQDSGIPHNVAIYNDSSKTEVKFRGDPVTGPAQATYDVPALPAGTYYFQCDIHPQMNGTFVVQ